MTLARRLGMLPRVNVQRSGSVFSLLAACAVLVAGCNSGTETGNPSVTGSLSYTGYSSAPDDYGIGEGGSIATIERAWFGTAEVDFSISSADGCEGDAPEGFVAPALGVGDHAAGNHNSTPFTAKPGAFCGVELPFVPVSRTAEGVPAELAGHAILVEGTLADGTPFRIVSDSAPRVQLTADVNGAFDLGANEADLLLAFDFATWLSRMELILLEPNEDGVIEITAETNAAALSAFETSVGEGVRLFRDRDADGALDEDPELLAEAR